MRIDPGPCFASLDLDVLALVLPPAKKTSSINITYINNLLIIFNKYILKK